MKKFEVGKLYSMRSACDHNCIWSYTVIKRTAKTVTLQALDGEIINNRVKEYENQEFCKPLGTYSMSPTLRAC